MRLLMILLATALTGRSEIRDVLKSADIDAILAKTEKSTDVLVKSNYIISLRVQAEPGSWVTHLDADEVWVVRRGSARLTLGETNLATGVRRSDRSYEVGAGDVVNLPRTTAYLLVPSARFEFVAVQIFPASRRSQPTAPAAASGGRGPAGGPMPDVVRNAAIQDTFLKNTVNQPLHRMGAASMNHVIYNGAPGPYEVHLSCEDLYFVRLGSGRARLDGHLLNPEEQTPGEVRGTGVYGAREYQIGVGDILSIPRNTAHHMDPGDSKLGYLLLKVWE